MLAGLDAYTPTFLSNVDAAQTRINTANEQLSSGYRVNVPSDDPGAIVAILGFQSQIDNVTQVQSNLAQATTIATVSDTALNSASDLLDQLSSIADQGSSSDSTAAINASLAKQVQAIGDQMVALANTSFAGQYVFGGDNSTTQPYTSNFDTLNYSSTAVPPVSSTSGYTENGAETNTLTLTNSDGASMLVPGQTAQQIFDAQTSTGTPAVGNILNNIGSLILALQSNDLASIQAAAISTDSVTQLEQATTISGNTISWLAASTTTAASNLTSLQTELGGLRDADATAAATNLTSGETALQAAIAAQGTLNIKNLFSYLG
jgi:flagellar hook-associated protein 3 FlgL